MLYVCDMDGTLIASRGNRPASTTAEQALLPGVAERCQALLDNGDILAVASNQGGVAMGLLTLQQAEALVRHAASLIGAAYYEFCPYHPQGILAEYTADAACRKPHPAMIQALQRRTGTPWSEIVFVGNEASDWQAALAAGVQFVWANDFF